MGLTSRLAAFAVGRSFSDIPAQAIGNCKQMMLNAAAVGLAGSAEKEGQIIAEYVQQVGGSTHCTVIGTAIRTSPVNAALANGTMVHVLDYDEAILRRANHPSNSIYPTVMALGEQLAATGKEALAAFTIGCEVSTKIGIVGDLDKLQPPISSLGWHLEGVAGTIGSTAAAGKLLKLGQEQMENALAIAVSEASGIKSNFGTSTKSLHCGRAAMNGIMAAMLAQKGFTGAKDAIEGPKGFLDCFRRDRNVDEDDFIRQLGNPFDVVDPGMALKLYPCGSATHTAIDAALRLRSEHKINPKEVRSVRVAIPPHMAMPFPRPETGLQGKFSVHYCVATALVHGQPRIHHFTDAAVRDPEVVAMLDKTTVETTEKATKEVSRPSTVALTLAGGQEIACRIEHPKGHPSDPLTAQELEDKFLYCSRDILPPERRECVIAQFRRLEELSNVQPLFSALGGSGA